jgi:hypothetical protein
VRKDPVKANVMPPLVGNEMTQGLSALGLKLLDILEFTEHLIPMVVAFHRFDILCLLLWRSQFPQ